jgi:hypothetical protein
MFMLLILVLVVDDARVSFGNGCLLSCGLEN